MARKYELATHHLVILNVPGHGKVDLRTITLATANELHQAGNFPYLKLKQKKKA